MIRLQIQPHFDQQRLVAYAGSHLVFVQRQLDGNQQRLWPQALFRWAKLRLTQPAFSHRQVQQPQLLVAFYQRVARRVNHQYPTKAVLAARQRCFPLDFHRWEQRLFRRFLVRFGGGSGLQQLAIQLTFALLITAARVIGRLRRRFARNRRCSRLNLAAWRRLREMVAAGSDAVFRLPGRSGFLVLFIRQRQRRSANLLQHGGYRLIDKIMYQPRLMETHLMLGWMNIHVDLMRIYFEIQHISGLLLIF
ncbi:hypothetical protein D3C81_570600 [compost metagenome]